MCIAMLRPFSTRAFDKLWKCSRFVGARWQVVRVSPAWGLDCHPTSTHPRCFNTGSFLKQEKIELDKWKSIMRSQAASTERQHDKVEDEASDEDGNDAELQGAVGVSSLEATRDLVVMWRYAGKMVPQEITDEEIQMLAELPTKSAKKKYLKYLAAKEGHKRARKEKQQQKKVAREASLEQKRAQEGDEPKEWKNSFILQFWNRTLDRLLGWRSAQAMTFGQPLVFDMSYEAHMSRREIENTVSQLMEVEGWNRRAVDPFHLHFCNLQPDGAYMNEFRKRYGEEAWERLFITDTVRQHIEVFPRERLVYLTADSPNILRTFDHSKVYIIGAMVDRSIQTGLSLANAKRLKLATARLPLNEFLHWEMGAKNLTLDQMIRIMMTAKDTGRWEDALKFVPTRKHDGFHQQREVRSERRESDNGAFGSPRKDRTLRGGEQSVSRSHRDSGFGGMEKVSGSHRGRENQRATTRVRTSFKNTVEGGKSNSKSKQWWNAE